MSPAPTTSPNPEPSGAATAEMIRSAQQLTETAPIDSSEPGVSGEQPADPNNTQEIFTIGHAALPWSQFLELLHRFEISLLVDIRRFPGSRHAPQFGEDVMRAALTADGIEYLHLLELGGRRRARPDSLEFGLAERFLSRVCRLHGNGGISERSRQAHDTRANEAGGHDVRRVRMVAMSSFHGFRCPAGAGLAGVAYHERREATAASFHRASPPYGWCAHVPGATHAERMIRVARAGSACLNETPTQLCNDE